MKSKEEILKIVQLALELSESGSFSLGIAVGPDFSCLSVSDLNEARDPMKATMDSSEEDHLPKLRLVRHKLEVRRAAIDTPENAKETRC